MVPTPTVPRRLLSAFSFNRVTIRDFLERWYSDDTDVRADEDIGRDILELLQSHAVTSCVVVDGIIGCPHEEGIDYPEGKSCPKCPFWAGRDRFLHERIHWSLKSWAVSSATLPFTLLNF
jgi:hypothetical protein